jgi:hypothetical protein
MSPIPLVDMADGVRPRQPAWWRPDDEWGAEIGEAL